MEPTLENSAIVPGIYYSVCRGAGPFIIIRSRRVSGTSLVLERTINRERTGSAGLHWTVFSRFLYCFPDRANATKTQTSIRTVVVVVVVVVVVALTLTRLTCPYY